MMSLATQQALQLMLYGVSGVFLVLGIFILSIVLLVKAFPLKEDDE